MTGGVLRECISWCCQRKQEGEHLSRKKNARWEEFTTVIHCKVITINYCRYLRCTIILVGYLFLVLDLNKMHVTTRTIAATATTPAIRIERPVYHWEYDTKLVNSTETQKQTRLWWLLSMSQLFWTWYYHDDLLKDW